MWYRSLRCQQHTQLALFTVAGRPVGRAGLQRLHASLAVIVSKRRFHHAGAAAAASRQDGSCAPESTSRGSVAARSPNPPAPKRYAVIGGGFAGVAVAFHLLSRASHTHPISLDLYEAFGLGAGGSGAAAGLLHPYTTRGKVLWRGLEAFEAALELVQAAEEAMRQGDSEGLPLDFTWRDGILRPARSQKQAQELAKFVPQDTATAAATGAELVGTSLVKRLVPGLPADSLIVEEGQKQQSPAVSLSPQQLKQQQKAQKQQQQQQQGGSAANQAAGVLVRNAIVLHPLRYLEAAWAACCQLAKHAGQGSAARLIPRTVTSLGELEKEEGPYDAVIVAAGAAVGSIAELQGVLPVQLCQGYALIMQPPSADSERQKQQEQPQDQGQGAVHVSAVDAQQSQHADQALRRQQEQAAQQQQPQTQGSPPSLSSSYPKGAPSLLGPTYISAHGPTSLVVGATKRYGLSPEEAFAECARGGVVESREGQQEALEGLLPAAGELWPPILGWEVAQVKSGVRALPARGREGSIPFAGRVPVPASTHGIFSDTSPTASSLGHTPTAQRAPELQKEEEEVGRWQQQQQEGGCRRARRLVQGQQQRGGNWWFVGGLGARGLVYHAWLGRLVTEAVSRDDEGVLPPELLRWKAAD